MTLSKVSKVTVSEALAANVNVQNDNFVPLVFDGDSPSSPTTDEMSLLMSVGFFPKISDYLAVRKIDQSGNVLSTGVGALSAVNDSAFFNAAYADGTEVSFPVEELRKLRKDVQVDAGTVLIASRVYQNADDPSELLEQGLLQRWSSYLPLLLKYKGVEGLRRGVIPVARALGDKERSSEEDEEEIDDHERLIALLDLLYVHAEKRTDVASESGGGGGGGGTDLTKRHVPVVPFRMTIGLVNEFYGGQPLLATKKVTVAGRDFVVYSDSSKTMYAEVGRGNISTGVVVREESGRLTAFESTDVDVNVGFEPTSYENIPYKVGAVESYVSTWVSGAFQTIASTNVQDLMVASKDAGEEYTHFIDSRGSDAFPEWVKAMRHATQGPKYVLTLALTPFGKSEDGLATAILKEPPDDGRPEPDGYEHHLLMNDELWNSVQCLVYPIPRAKGSLGSLGIIEWHMPGNYQHEIRRDPADGEYIVLEGPDDNTSWAQNHLVPLDEFVIMGYLYRANGSGGNTPVNVVALRHKTFPVVENNPTYPMKMQMKEGGISQFSDSRYVSHLAIAELPFQTEGVIQWVLGEQFRRLMNQTQELGEEGDATNAVNIFYDIGIENGRCIEIFPLSGSVLRVKFEPEEY